VAEPMTYGRDECRDPETIAAYLDGRLPEREREAMAAHLASCETCYFLFVESAQTRPPTATVETSERWWKRPIVMWPATAGLATAATVLLAFTFGIVPGQRSDEPALQALVAAVGADRTFVPRLTGGFAHGPVRGAIRSGNSGSATQSPDVRIAAARIEKETEAQPLAQALHALGIAELVTGRLDIAVVALEDSASQRPTDPRILNDLASAYLVRSEQSGNRDDLSKALVTLNRALEVDRTVPEVLFNRAYTLERLSLIPEAREAWQAYLTIDNRSGWADEARARLRALSPEP
jgi:anti-sigma factor RsiW